MPIGKRRTRQSSKLRQESDDPTDTSDDSSPLEEENRTIRESEVNMTTMEDQLQQLREQLETAVVTANEEKRERQRLEQLLHEQQTTSGQAMDNPSASNSTITSATAAHVKSVAPAVSSVTFVTSSAAISLPHSSADSEFRNPNTSIETNINLHRPPASNAVYSWSPMIPSSTNFPQAFPSSSVHLSPSSLAATTDAVPTFLPPLNALQTFEHQRYVPVPDPLHLRGTQVPSTSSVMNGFHRKLHDLPEFRGRPEEWPMFCTAFIESSNMFGYSNVENMFRLQKSVKGEARDVVESLLIHPNNVQQVMANLEFRFGRPECLIQSQLRKVRAIPSIPENKLEQIVPFATKVQNLSVFLEASGMHQHIANPTLLDELVGKLPMNKRLDWAQHSVGIQPYPTIKHFNDWLGRVARLICIITPTSLPSSNPSDSPTRPRKGNVLHTTQTEERSNKCRHCDKTRHPITDCNSFTKLQTAAKWDFVKKNNLCFGCLKYGHSIRSCRTKRSCGIANCQKRHHQSLHDTPPVEKSSPEAMGKEASQSERSVLNCNGVREARILFKVLPIRIYSDNMMIRTFALLDEGSSVTIICSDLAKRLSLNGKPRDLNLRWIGRETKPKKSFIVDVMVSADQEEAERFELCGVQTVEELCLPTQTFLATESILHYRPEIYLANYNQAKPEILIGLDNSHLGVPMDIVDYPEEGPIIALTKLGWVAYGRMPSVEEDTMRENIVLCSSQSSERDLQLHQIVEDYFCIESFGVTKPTEKLISEKDRRASQLLSDTTVRLNKRFQTGLLWKEDELHLPNSHELAKKRLLSLEARMRMDPVFATEYKNIIASYLQKSYAVKLTPAEADIRTPKTWYLPHFGVRNPNKPGKIRLVFDAAAEVGGVSLNSFLLKGPDEYVPLVKVLCNFRMRPVGITGDIKEMFHQVLIRPEDQHSQRFLWREDEGKPIDVYMMKAMTFGAACSPCSANYVKNLNALRFLKEHPRAVKAIISHHYVDDYVDSFASASEALAVTKAVIEIHRDAGFELRNFTSNSKEVLQSISQADVPMSRNGTVNMDMDFYTTSEKVLGLCWKSDEDVFMFRLNFPRVNQYIMTDDRCPTKREFLSITMSIFDPLGMIANYTLPLKLILKSIWRYGVGWDEPIPVEAFTRWKDWKSLLPRLAQLKIPRCHNCNLIQASRVDLHTFVDASEEAFSAVSYLRIEYNGEVFVSFVCGKTRGSPKKLLSIPRLELSAAILGTRLCNAVLDCHDIYIADRIFWSDSKTVLHWLRSDPCRHKEFVAFRIAEILQSSRVGQWRWVPSKMNPADDATRASSLQSRNDNRWLKGPAFLTFPESGWPQPPNDIADHERKEEIRSKYVLIVTPATEPLYDASRFSSLLKLRRTMAWLTRFINACQRKQIEQGELTAVELKNAEELVYRQTQMEVYANDIETLRRNLPLEKRSQLFKMTPYLDEFGLVRAFGRIEAATTVPFETKRPIIMPKNHVVTKLLVREYHNRCRHQNEDTIVNEIRQRFWVPSLRVAVKRCKSECQLCRIRRAKPQPPLMGQLPEDRLTPFVRPFTYTGLDYFGPVNVTIRRRTEKRWVALFTCLTVRAIHMEIATNLSTDACILCIRNFVNRRGTPLRIRSDNGTNFLGASKELATNDIFDNEAIKAELSSAGIEWVFNCPVNPHAGGCWERLVQSVKRALSHSLHETSPKIETLQSALIEAENIINSRPLTHLPVSVEEEEPLTPNHFILGVPNSTQTPGPVEQRALCLRKQWRVSQQLKNRFWKRWIREYLPVLTRRCKWFEMVPQLEVGNLVLVCDVDAPRSQWIRGRITKVFPGPDGQVRSAELKTASGILRRPAVRLALLDVSEATDLVASRGVGCRKLN